MYFFRSTYVGSQLLMCYEFKLSEKIKITIINIYGKYEHQKVENYDKEYISYSDTTIHRMLSDIVPIIIKAESNNIIVLGGDLNADVNAKKGHYDKPIFDRIENLGFKNLTQNIITYEHGIQDDYIFLYDGLNLTKPTQPIINKDVDIQEISPHYFIKVNLKIDL